MSSSSSSSSSGSSASDDSSSSSDSSEGNGYHDMDHLVPQEALQWLRSHVQRHEWRIVAQPRPRVHACATGIDVVPSLEAVSAYFGSKKYLRVKSRQEEDWNAFKPHIDMDEVRAHMKGRKYLRALEERKTKESMRAQRVAKRKAKLDAYKAAKAAQGMDGDEEGEEHMQLSAAVQRMDAMFGGDAEDDRYDGGYGGGQDKWNNRGGGGGGGRGRGRGGTEGTGGTGGHHKTKRRFPTKRIYTGDDDDDNDATVVKSTRQHVPPRTPGSAYADAEIPTATTAEDHVMVKRTAAIERGDDNMDIFAVDAAPADDDKRQRTAPRGRGRGGGARDGHERKRPSQGGARGRHGMHQQQQQWRKKSKK